VVVSSVAHEHGRLDLDDLAMERGYRPFAAYSRSKLANLLFVRELARRLEGTGVTVNAVHPGLVRTRLGDHSGPVRRAGWQLLHVAYRRSSLTPAQGADTIVHLAASPAVAGVSGRYFVDRAPVEPAPAALDDALAERLWAVSEHLTAALAEAR
jgi:NAD(P)-dependent dehydrogenase (short-subunit alcohol dehydrogenase family)